MSATYIDRRSTVTALTIVSPSLMCRCLSASTNSSAIPKLARI